LGIFFYYLASGQTTSLRKRGDLPTMAAIGRPIVTLAAEVVGYSRLIRADEKGALEQLNANRDQFVYPKIAEHSGRIIRTTGENLLAEFESATEAVRCAAELQSGMIDRNIRTLPDRRITFRVGVTIDQAAGNGDDLVIRAVAALPRDTLATLIKPGAGLCGERGDTAVRLAALAEPGGICISGAVRDAIGGQLPYIFKDIGKQNLEIRGASVECYAMSADAVASGPRLAAQNPQPRPMRLRRAAVAVGVFAAVGVCGVAWLAWLATHPSTAPIHAPATAGSDAPSVAITADGAALASSPQQTPLVSSTAADNSTQTPPVPPSPLAGGMVTDRAKQAPSTSQPSLTSNAAADSRIQALSSRPAPSEIGAVVVRGKQAVSALQTTDNNGTPALRGTQTPSVLQTTENDGAAVVRGNQAPSAPEIAPDGATDVIRGTRIISQAPLSSRPDQR
jgi:class 3 adenylate cyclase